METQSTARPRRRLSRAERRAQTHEELLEAAARVFARKGYAGASVDDIAEEAGFTVGALYSNFAGKQDLFLAAFERHCDQGLARIQSTMGGPGSTKQRLEAYSRQFAELSEHRQWWLLSAELWLYAQRHPEAAARMAAVQADARAVIAEALGRRGEPLGEELAAVIHALWTGFMHYRLISPEAVSADAFARAVGALLDGKENQLRKGRQR